LYYQNEIFLLIICVFFEIIADMNIQW